MTILSDREIRRRCIQPRFLMDAIDGSEENIPVSPPYNDYEQLVINEWEGRTRQKKGGIPVGSSSIRHFLKGVPQGSEFRPMLNPFVPELVREVDNEKIISYGSSSYGYDVRIAPEFKIFTNVNHTILDPKAIDERSFVDHKGEYCIIPPNSFVLARTVEYFDMPKNVTGLVLTKSTYARLGIFALTTVIEAGWKGQLVLEYANFTPLPAKLYANEGAAQIIFFEGNPCDVPYDINRKYQGQMGITLPKV